MIFKKTGLVTIATVLVAMCAPSLQAADNYYKHLAVNVYPQDDRCWCSIATLAMWADWQNGKTKDTGVPQKDLAKTYGVGSYDSKKKECSTGGLNANQLADALEEEAVSWGFSSYSTKTDDTFASKIVKEINDDGQPVAVVCNTRYTSGTVKPNQHYMIVDAFQNTTVSYSSSASKIRGYWVNDPAYGANNLSSVASVSPKTFISKSDFLTKYASKYNSKYYLVED